jgi:hypothetical protein
VGVAGLDVATQIDSGGPCPVAQLATVFERQAGHGVRHVAVECLQDGGLQLGSPVALQQPEQGGHDGSQIAGNNDG